MQNRGFKHCVNTELSSVLVHGFREVPEIVVRIVVERRVIIDGSILVEIFGLITFVERGLGPIAKQLVLVRMTCAFRSGKFGRKSCQRTAGARMGDT